MTLREYFAAHAPVTLSDAKIECGYVGGCCINEQEIRVVMAILSMMRFAYADVMIEARNK